MLMLTADHIVCLSQQHVAGQSTGAEESIGTHNHWRSRLAISVYPSSYERMNPKQKRHVRAREPENRRIGYSVRNCLELSRTPTEQKWQTENRLLCPCDGFRYRLPKDRKTYLICPCHRSGLSVPTTSSCPCPASIQQVSTRIPSYLSLENRYITILL
jgi:hypothetical protein